jgi:hypothetical protein
MTRRLCKRERQQILQEMINLARFLTGKGVQPPEIKAAVGLLKTDLIVAYRHAITVTTVDRNTYLEQCTSQASTEEPV